MPQCSLTKYGQLWVTMGNCGATSGMQSQHSTMQVYDSGCGMHVDVMWHVVCGVCMDQCDM